MGRRNVVMKLICLLGHCECDGHTVNKLSQRHLTAEWLAPRDSDCWRMHSKVSSDWLPSYIKSTRPVLKSFKTARYFPDSHRTLSPTSSLYTLHKLSQQRLTTDWLAPQESDYSRMYSKVFSAWLPSYIKATWPVLEIFKMAWYFPDSHRTRHVRQQNGLVWISHKKADHVLYGQQY